MMCAALLLAAACGDDGAREPAPQAAADSQPAPAAAPAPADTGTRVPESVPQSGASVPQPGTEPVPTAADSAAGAREDVSPEWKMRERTMASYEQCMEQARAVEPPMRERLEAACGRRSGAP
jgi:hypothetical protein